MTLEEKASLCSGDDFWKLKAVERLNLNSIMMTDGPHGLRKQVGSGDHLGIKQSIKATCFPTASATAALGALDILSRYKLRDKYVQVIVKANAGEISKTEAEKQLVGKI